MQCKQINDLTMKYLDGNISELELGQLMRHNQKCPACAEEFEILRDAIFEIETFPDIEPPAGLNAKIMAAVAEQKHFSLNPELLLCLLVSFAGLVLFTFNIITNVVLPSLGGGLIASDQSFVQLLYLMAEKAKDGFVTLSLYLGKLLVFRNILFKEHIVLIFLWVSAFAIADLILYKITGLKKKKDFADLK